MDLLVHHEFGLHHKVPIINDDKSCFLALDNNMDYWVKIWYLFYNQVYQKYSKKDNFYFFCYEDFVKEPERSLKDLLNVLNLPKSLINSISIKKFNHKNEYNNKTLDTKHIDLYKELRSCSLNNYG